MQPFKYLVPIQIGIALREIAPRTPLDCGSQLFEGSYLCPCPSRTPHMLTVCLPGPPGGGYLRPCLPHVPAPGAPSMPSHLQRTTCSVPRDHRSRETPTTHAHPVGSLSGRSSHLSRELELGTIGDTLHCPPSYRFVRSHYCDALRCFTNLGQAC